MNKARITGQRGFTLTELVIGMAVMTIILAAIFGILSSSIRTQQYGFGQERSYTELRQVMQALSDGLRYSTNHVIDNTNKQITFSSPNQAGVIEAWTIGLNNGSIQVTHGTVNQQLGDGLIQNLSFNQNGTRITFTVTALVQGGSLNSTMTMTSDVWTGRILYR